METTYTVLSFIFGGYEPVREVLEKDPNAEYVLVTDDPTLESKTWKVVYDDNLAALTQYRKVCNVRYKPFKYVKTDVCILVDGSMQIKQPLYDLVHDFNEMEADMAICGHPFFSSIIQEYKCWVADKRGRYSVDKANANLSKLQSFGYDFNFKSHVQCGFKVVRNNKICRDLDAMTLSLLEYLGTEDEIERLDQCVYNYVLNKFFRSMRIMALSPQVYNSSYMQIYEHGT